MKMKIEHLKLHLSEGRPLDAVDSIQNKIILDAKESLEGIQDPESLLTERKILRSKKESIQAHIKKHKTSNTKSNKERDLMLKQWKLFVASVLELSEKHNIDFEQFPSYLASGKTFIQQLQNIRPDSFVKVKGLSIPQKRTEASLDDKIVELFEVEVKQELLEEIIKKKAKAMKELFSSDLE